MVLLIQLRLTEKAEHLPIQKLPRLVAVVLCAIMAQWLVMIQSDLYLITQVSRVFVCRCCILLVLQICGRDSETITIGEEYDHMDSIMCPFNLFKVVYHAKSDRVLTLSKQWEVIH